jgi:hypothetical protein
MAGMQQIKASIGKDDFASVFFEIGDDGRQFCQ